MIHWFICNTLEPYHMLSLHFQIGARRRHQAAAAMSGTGGKEAVEFHPNPSHLDGVADMSALIYLEGPNVLHNLDKRYEKNEIYTSISKVLIAINPFQDCVDYSQNLMTEYREAAKDKFKMRKMAPHVFSVSQNAYYKLVKFKQNQSMIVCGESGSGKTESANSMIVCGESGSGKTESAKHLMRYLAWTPRTHGASDSKTVSMEQQVLDANPILESFGNAKTVLNWNSSRFGKFTKIIFDNPDQEKIVGSVIETYLLEKSRITHQNPGERNYHIFYYLCKYGALPDDKYEKWQMDDADNFYYTNQGESSKVKEVSDVERFQEMKAALGTLKIEEELQWELLEIAAGLLHLGNIVFEPDAADVADIKSDDSINALDLASFLLHVPQVELKSRLLTQNLVIAGTSIQKQLTPELADSNRDAVTKAVYSGMFDWIVRRINKELYPHSARSPGLKWIGILDVFGFEIFEHNCFEQFCINFANERLQQYFNVNIIKSEQALYQAESILWEPITVPDNEDVIQLVAGKQRGIFDCLDTACKMPKGDDAVFTQTLFQMNKYHPRMRKVDRMRSKESNQMLHLNGFSVQHYAGLVVYNAQEFLRKNKDQNDPDTVKLFCSSKKQLTKELLEDEEVGENGTASGKPNGKKQTRQRKNVRFTEEKSGGSNGPRKADTTFKSLGNTFNTQLDGLMKTLYQTDPYFVRCIKPNAGKQPNDFDKEYIMPQLECGGIIEALRILKCGYPSRCNYDDIFSRYGEILKPTPPNLNKRDFCEAVLRHAGEPLDPSEYQLGLSKVFFKPGKQAWLETLLQGDRQLSPEAVLAIKTFLLSKRLRRARGVMTVHRTFVERLREQRALLRVRRLVKMTRVLSKTMLHPLLTHVRPTIAAQNLQACFAAGLAVQERQAKAAAILTLQAGYRRRRFRMSMQQELARRIKAKRLAREEEERRRKEAEEALRMNSIASAELARQQAEAKKAVDAANKEREKAVEEANKEREKAEQAMKARVDAANKEREQAQQAMKEREEAANKERERAEQAMKEREEAANKERERAEQAIKAREEALRAQSEKEEKERITKQQEVAAALARAKDMQATLAREAEEKEAAARAEVERAKKEMAELRQKEVKQRAELEAREAAFKAREQEQQELQAEQERKVAELEAKLEAERLKQQQLQQQQQQSVPIQEVKEVDTAATKARLAELEKQLRKVTGERNKFKEDLSEMEYLLKATDEGAEHAMASLEELEAAIGEEREEMRTEKELLLLERDQALSQLEEIKSTGVLAKEAMAQLEAEKQRLEEERKKLVEKRESLQAESHKAGCQNCVELKKQLEQVENELNNFETEKKQMQEILAEKKRIEEERRLLEKARDDLERAKQAAVKARKAALSEREELKDRVQDKIREREQERQREKQAIDAERRQVRREREALEREKEEWLKQRKQYLKHRKEGREISESELDRSREEGQEDDGTDKLAQILITGLPMLRHAKGSEEPQTVQVSLNEEGVLSWQELTTDESGDIGHLHLKYVSAVVPGPYDDEADGQQHRQFKDAELFLHLVVKQRSELGGWADTKGLGDGEALELQVSTSSVRDKWVTALRYCARNFKELARVSRPVGDPARGNELAARLTDQLSEQKEHNKKLHKKLERYERMLFEALANGQEKANLAQASPEQTSLGKRGRQPSADLSKHEPLPASPPIPVKRGRKHSKDCEPSAEDNSATSKSERPVLLKRAISLNTPVNIKVQHREEVTPDTSMTFIRRRTQSSDALVRDLSRARALSTPPPVSSSISRERAASVAAQDSLRQNLHKTASLQSHNTRSSPVRVNFFSHPRTEAEKSEGSGEGLRAGDLAKRAIEFIEKDVVPSYVKKPGREAIGNLVSQDEGETHKLRDAPILRGYLRKQGSRKSRFRAISWQKRWFETEGALLLYYENDRSTDIRAAIELRQLQDVQRGKKPNEFALVFPEKVWLLAAQDATEASTWMTGLRLRRDLLWGKVGPAPPVSPNRKVHYRINPTSSSAKSLTSADFSGDLYMDGDVTPPADFSDFPNEAIFHSFQPNPSFGVKEHRVKRQASRSSKHDDDALPPPPSLQTTDEFSLSREDEEYGRDEGQPPGPPAEPWEEAKEGQQRQRREGEPEHAADHEVPGPPSMEGEAVPPPPDIPPPPAEEAYGEGGSSSQASLLESEDSFDGPTFEVQAIIAEKKDKKGEKVFRVRWKGYGEDEDTWEPLENIKLASEALQRWKEHGRKEKNTRRNSGGERQLARGRNSSAGTVQRRQAGQEVDAGKKGKDAALANRLLDAIFYHCRPYPTQISGQLSAKSFGRAFVKRGTGSQIEQRMHAFVLQWLGTTITPVIPVVILLLVCQDGREQKFLPLQLLLRTHCCTGAAGRPHNTMYYMTISGIKKSDFRMYHNVLVVWGNAIMGTKLEADEGRRLCEEAFALKREQRQAKSLMASVQENEDILERLGTSAKPQTKPEGDRVQFLEVVGYIQERSQKEKAAIAPAEAHYSSRSPSASLIDLSMDEDSEWDIDPSEFEVKKKQRLALGSKNMHASELSTGKKEIETDKSRSYPSKGNHQVKLKPAHRRKLRAHPQQQKLAARKSGRATSAPMQKIRLRMIWSAICVVRMLAERKSGRATSAPMQILKISMSIWSALCVVIYIRQADRSDQGNPTSLPSTPSDTDAAESRSPSPASPEPQLPAMPLAQPLPSASCDHPSLPDSSVEVDEKSPKILELYILSGQCKLSTEEKELYAKYVRIQDVQGSKIVLHVYGIQPQRGQDGATAPTGARSRLTALYSKSWLSRFGNDEKICEQRPAGYTAFTVEVDGDEIITDSFALLPHLEGLHILG
eukprot:g76738.t1